jgi:hypothetical protein
MKNSFSDVRVAWAAELAECRRNVAKVRQATERSNYASEGGQRYALLRPILC